MRWDSLNEIDQARKKLKIARFTPTFEMPSSICLL